MIVDDLLVEIEKCRKKYGDDFLKWNVYTEQIHEDDKIIKTKLDDWKVVKDEEDFEYFKCEGFCTKFPDRKIFTININY